ncbi:MAG TPA: riboflavin synthase [Aquiluna sp.]
MFTGIIEELGEVKAIEEQQDAIRLTIGAKKVLSDLGRGDSISCSGTCLTAIEIDDSGFTADVMLETLKRSSLSEVKVGDPINLERAMSATTRFGGHVVQGHVDGVGEFVSREKSDNWDWVRIKMPHDLMKYVVMKGSITFDGISLTVNEIDGDVIGLSLIPETLTVTTLGYKKPGDKVNVEADILAKHIERLMEHK